MRPIILFSIGAAAMVAQGAWGQKPATWRSFRVADGLPELGCGTVTLSAQGKALVTHLRQPLGSALDGYTVSVFALPDQRCGRVYEGPSGQIWTVVANGLEEYKEGRWVHHPIPEVSQALSEGTGLAVDDIRLLPVRQGKVLVLLPHELLGFTSDFPQARTEVLLTSSRTTIGEFKGMVRTRDGGVWLSGERGLCKATVAARGLKPESEWLSYTLPTGVAGRDLLNPHENEDGSVTSTARVGTGERTIVHFDGRTWSSHSAGAEDIRHAWQGSDRTFWALSPAGLFQWEMDVPGMVEIDDLTPRQYLDVAVEAGGRFLLATSDGLIRHAPSLWRTPSSISKVSGAAVASTADKQERVWFVAGNALHVIDGEKHRAYPFAEAGQRVSQSIRAIYSLKDETLVLDAGNQVWRFDPENGTYKAFEQGGGGGHLRPLGLLKDGSLCFQLDSRNKKQEIELVSYDGRAFTKVTDSLPQPLPGAQISICFTAHNGDLWIGGERGTATLRDNTWRSFVAADQTSPEAPISLAELADGKIWCATTDKIWEFDGQKWSSLRRGFEGLNALARSRDGSIWAASSSGVHRFFQGHWLENGVEDGLPAAIVLGLCEDSLGHLWAATLRGVSRFYPEADPDPPQAFFIDHTEQPRAFPEGATMNPSFGGADKWKYTQRNRLLFSHRMDEQDWSSFQEASAVSFADLPSGKHFFQVRAMDRNGNVDPKPAQMQFVVVAPWYREMRLVWGAVAALAVVLFFAALAFNRHRRLVRSYAEIELKVAERTRELELANRELLHSQKMNALGTLAAGIAHDFNNILSIIKGSAQIIEDNLDQPQKVATRVERIKTVVEQGAGIVKAMLGFSRESDQQAAACDLNIAVEDTIKLLGDRFLREVLVRFEPSPSLPELRCSKDFIQQILLNFIFNAAESSEGRKEIVLSTAVLPELPADLVLAPAKPPSYAAISVRDFGSGIAPENMPRIFEPFFTTKALSVRRGTGLGLSMVYELAKKMGAGLVVASTVGKGSQFTLLVPVEKQEANGRVASGIKDSTVSVAAK